ncbi:hypothetical protein [Sphingomonas sp. PP-CE-1G-424]|uniref:hypothetical protein n=1 Tax=Sphingomonas sp. PP-CE-1G-424 TaxID=2135658 RepID=UPI001055E338|nr:hypothetical protein [Sphingomonas sp. PP-CE-1G-424]
MSRLFALGVFAALAACSSAGVGDYAAQAAPADGGTDARLSVLGLKVNDTPAVAQRSMAGEGFALVKAWDQCTNAGTFDAAVAEMVRNRFTSGSGMSCTQRYEDKAGRYAMVTFTLQSSGYLLNSVEYTMPYSGSAADLNAVMRKKYGASKGMFKAMNGPIPQYTTPADLNEHVYLRVGVTSNIAKITMADAESFKRVQSGKALSAAASKKSGASELKL